MFDAFPQRRRQQILHLGAGSPNSCPPPRPTPPGGGVVYIFKQKNLCSPKQEVRRKVLFFRFRFTNSKKIKFLAVPAPRILIFVCLIPLSVVPSLWCSPRHLRTRFNPKQNQNIHLLFWKNQPNVSSAGIFYAKQESIENTLKFRNTIERTIKSSETFPHNFNLKE